MWLTSYFGPIRCTNTSPHYDVFRGQAFTLTTVVADDSASLLWGYPLRVASAIPCQGKFVSPCNDSHFSCPLYLRLIACVFRSVCWNGSVYARFSGSMSWILRVGDLSVNMDSMAGDLSVGCTAGVYNRLKRLRIVKPALILVRIMARSNCRRNSIARLERP